MRRTLGITDPQYKEWSVVLFHQEVMFPREMVSELAMNLRAFIEVQHQFLMNHFEARGPK